MSRFVLTAQLQLQAPTNVAQVVRQIQSQLNNVNVNVQVQNTGQAQRQLNNVTTACNNATTAADRLGRTFGISIRRFAAFGIATRAVSLFTNTLSNAIKEAIAFDQELVKVIQVSGATRAELNSLVKTVTRLSTSLGVSSRDVLEAGKTLVQAGVSFDDARIALDALAKSALAPNFDSLSETTEGAVAILAQFKQGVGALEGQLSSVNAVAGAFAVEASDLIDVVRRAGGVFKSSGGNLNELLALFTSVRATTRESAESIGTGLRTIFTRIQRPKTIEFLKQFGVQLTDLQGRFVGPFEAVRRLSDALAGLGEGDITFIRIAEELGGFRQIGKVLPLLQQFQTAQEALNVAQNAGTGLTKDALTAQQALAIRITKVKEEFLALARSITETATFQVFANTALNLASALIKLADALKPIIPLLTVVAGIRLARGFGNFAGGILGGLGSTRTFNKGGKVHQFARGGMVPGTGNRDTVPAMLTPGEFVIRKSSVNKLGASNLAAMNENKYATGGIVVDPTKIGGFFLRPEEGIDRRGSSVSGMINITNPKALKLLGQKIPIGEQRQAAFDNLTKDKQAKLLGITNIKGSKVSSKFLFNNQGQLDLSTKTARNALRNSGIDPDTINQDRVSSILNRNIKSGKFQVSGKDVPVSGSISSYFPGKADLQNNKNPQIVSKVAENTRKGLFNTILKTIDPIIEIFNNPIISPNRTQARSGAKKIANDPNARATTEGFIFEGLVQSLTGAKLGGGQRSFDYPNRSIANSRDSLKAMFTDSSGEGIDTLIKADAKRTNSPEAMASIVNKIKNDINKGDISGVSFQKFSRGGIAEAPLVDDILQAPGSILPRPSSAIQALIKAGGGAVDIDRTLKRTIGDTAYAKAPTSGAKQAALDTYFNDEARRLQDVKSAPLTQFGKELQAAVKSGQINPNRLSIISKSRRVRGVAQYLNGLFGIPTSNMIFTQGGSKEPALSALRTKGPRSNRVPFATGGGVGSDSVPALLTPGEFVVNRKSAQSIGYGNLNRMNKVGKYANGGVVQHFSQGTSGKGVQPIGVASPSIDANRYLTAVITRLKSLDITIAQSQTAMSSLKQISPSLYASLNNYANETNLTSKQQAKIALEYVETAKFLRKQGSTVKEVEQDMLEFAKGLSSVTESLKQTRKAAAAANQPVVASPSSAPQNSPQILPRVQSSSASQAPSSQPATPSVIQRRGTYQAPTNVPSMSPPTQQMQQFGKAVTTATTNVQQNAKATNTSTQANNNARQSTSNAGLALSLIPATIQSFLPPIDESSSALTKLTSSLLSTITVIGSAVFALESFGVSLKASSVGNFLTGRGGRTKTKNQVARIAQSSSLRLADVGSGLNKIGLPNAGKAVSKFAANLFSSAGNIGKFATKFINFLGPVTAGIGALAIVDTIVGSFRDLDGQLKDAIKAQDTVKAQSLAVSKANADTLPIVGNLVGALFDAAGAGDTLAAGLTLVGGDTVDSIKSTIAAQIATAKANESLKKASEESAKAMQELQNGTITASEGLQRVAALTADAEAARQANIKAIEENAGNRSTVGGGAIARNIFTLGGLLGETSGQRNKRIGEEQEKLADENIRLQKESLAAQKPLIQATARSVFARGGSVDQAKAAIAATEGGITPEKLRQEAIDLRQKASRSFASGDTKTAEALTKQAESLSSEARMLDQELINLEKEVKRSQAAFAAMNLGLQGVSAAANAGVVGLNNYLAAQEFGNNALNSTIAVLEASITSAAQGISDSDFGDALSTASETLMDLGATPQQVAQVQNNIRAVNTAQKGFPSVISSLRETFKNQIKAGVKPDIAPENQKEIIGRILDQQLSDAGISDEARKAFKAQFDNLNLDPDAINKLIAGDTSVLEGPLKEIGEAALNQLLPVLKAQSEAQDKLNNLLRTKIELENKLISAQRQRLDIELEAAEIAAKYGGPAVTPEIRRQNVIAQANIQSGRSAPALKQGTAAEFNQRNTAIQSRLQQIANLRAQAAGEGPAAQSAREQIRNADGINLAAEEQRLQELAKSDYETTKQLIKLKEDELQLIKEKNKLEQDSIQSLISGDIEKFFEQQAAVGATAAIATGNQSLMRAFGASALGTAAQDIQRQQQAGVQTLFGQQLGGAGGLTERAFGAAIGARGIQDPRLAAIAAGTTAEEVSLQKDIVDLAGTLTNYGDVLVQSADNELNAANLQLEAAQKQLDAATQRVRDQEVKATNAKPLPLEEAAPKRLGGLIYASTGKFINFKPRGTDIVPAMLTPGEFVVRREAVQRGNNLSILKAMNRGQSNAQTTSNGGVASMASGGVVRYRANGSDAPESASGFGSFIEKLSNFGNALISFNQRFSENIDRLNNTTFNVKLDASNININLTGTSFIGKLKEDLQQELFAEIGRRLGNYQIGDGGKLKQNQGIVST